MSHALIHPSTAVGEPENTINVESLTVRYRFTIEIYGFTQTLRTCLARDTHDAIAMEVASGLGLREKKTTPE